MGMLPFKWRDVKVLILAESWHLLAVVFSFLVHLFEGFLCKGWGQNILVQESIEEKCSLLMKHGWTGWQMNGHIACPLSYTWAESCKNQLSDSWRTLVSVWLHLLAWQRLTEHRCVRLSNLIKDIYEKNGVTSSVELLPKDQFDDLLNTIFECFSGGRESRK